MKRYAAAAFITSGFFLLTACESTGNTSSDAAKALGESFSSAIVIDLEDFTAEGTVTRLDSGRWCVYFDSPSEIAGIQLDFRGDDVSASYKGLSFSVPQEALPSKALLSEFIKAADSLSQSENITGTEKDGITEVDGTADGEKYTIGFNADGSPAIFRMDNMGGSISFSDYTTQVRFTETSETIESLVITTQESTSETSAQN